MVKAFTNLMDILAPEIIAIPWMWVGPVHTCQKDPNIIYKKLYGISKEYIIRVKEGV